MSDAPAWLAPALDYAREWLGYQMRITEQPGCALAIAWRGEVVLEAAFGSADLSTGEALSPRHRFRVASHSKSFTAAAILKLREKGRLKLDDRAGEHVGGLHPRIAEASLAQLLSHTAGIFRDGEDAPYWAGRGPFPDEAKLRADLALAPAIEAGERLKYSNHGFALAGLVVEAAAGESWRAFVEREVVGAAGLGETSVDGPPPPGVPFARGHSGKALLGRRLVFPGDGPTGALAAATGFISTAGDLVRFFSQLSPRAATSFLSPASRREMARPQWKDRFSQLDRSYGLGLITAVSEGLESFGHSGGFLGYLSRTAVLAEADFAVSVLTNAADAAPEAWLEGVVSILARFRAEGAPEADLASWSGRWWSVWGAADLVPIGEKVILASPALAKPLSNAPEIQVVGADLARIAQAGGFHSQGEPARLIRNPIGEIVEVRIAASRFLKEEALAAELLGRFGGQSR
ncbi:MAG: serine hydrolase domain-containing protein [Caulobacteraceae bacterium]